MIEVLHLFPKLNALLINLLQGLTPSQWNHSTLCKKWTVKDIAAHLLDTALRRVSSGRDSHFAQALKINSYHDLLVFLNELNADWVKAYQRISPAVIVSQMELAQDHFMEHLSSLDLNAPALFPVSWAGEEQSRQWFDIAREYTERWHHQQQIRMAVGAPPILQPDLYFPFLDISMQALPFHYSSKLANEGTVLKINVVGDSGGSWSIQKNAGQWSFTANLAETPNQVYIDQNIAWMLLSKGMDISEAQQYWQVTGDYDLGYHALKMTAFMV